MNSATSFIVQGCYVVVGCSGVVCSSVGGKSPKTSVSLSSFSPTFSESLWLNSGISFSISMAAIQMRNKMKAETRYPLMILTAIWSSSMKSWGRLFGDELHQSQIKKCIKYI